METAGFIVECRSMFESSNFKSEKVREAELIAEVEESWAVLEKAIDTLGKMRPHPEVILKLRIRYENAMKALQDFREAEQK